MKTEKARVIVYFLSLSSFKQGNQDLERLSLVYGKFVAEVGVEARPPESCHTSLARASSLFCCVCTATYSQPAGCPEDHVHFSPTLKTLKLNLLGWSSAPLPSLSTHLHSMFGAYPGNTGIKHRKSYHYDPTSPHSWFTGQRKNQAQKRKQVVGQLIPKRALLKGQEEQSAQLWCGLQGKR